MNSGSPEQRSDIRGAPADLLVTVLTPPGRGAVATVEVSGAAAARTVFRFFEPLAPAGEANADHARRDADSWPINRIVVGYWQSPVGREQVVCARRAADRFEVHCHGGRVAVAAIVESLVYAGAQRQDWREWIARHETDPLAAAARVLLAEAQTLRAASILLDQSQGALSRALADVRRRIAADDVPSATQLLQELAATASVGLHLVEPWRVVLAGPPNAGKSSLINALLGYQRSIIAPLPGTTRDVLTAHTAIEGWPVELADTAGIVDSSDPLERAGVARARGELATADLVLWLIASDGPLESQLPVPEAIATRAIVVRSKCDLLRGDSARSSGPTSLPLIVTSAITGAGIPELLAAIARRLVPHPPAAAGAVIFTPQQRQACQQALDALARHDLVSAERMLAELVAC
ncbi:MAG: GTPase [Pirellulales bacterium]